MKDSGKRRSFDQTGAVRDFGEGKGRFDLLPVESLMRVARWYEKGHDKYCKNNEGQETMDISIENWKKGIPIGSMVDSAIRHLLKALRGDNDEDHLAAAVWNALGAMETERRVKVGLLPSDMDNRDYLQGGCRECILMKKKNPPCSYEDVEMCPHYRNGRKELEEVSTGSAPVHKASRTGGLPTHDGYDGVVDRLIGAVHRCIRKLEEEHEIEEIREEQKTIDAF